MIKNIGITLLFLCSLCGFSRSQEASFGRVREFDSEYHVKRGVPEDFYPVEAFVGMALDTAWDKRRDLDGKWVKSWHRIGLCGTLLMAGGRQCAVIYNDIIDLQFYRRPNVETYRGAYTEQRWGHRGEILALLMAQLGTADFRYEDYVSIVSGREARRRFGADSVFTFEVPIEPQKLNGSTYTRCAMLYLSRRGRVYMGFTFFFTEEGYRQKAKYMQALEGAVYYKRGRWRNKPEQVHRAERQERKKRS